MTATPKSKQVPQPDMPTLPPSAYWPRELSEPREITSELVEYRQRAIIHSPCTPEEREAIQAKAEAVFGVGNVLVLHGPRHEMVVVEAEKRTHYSYPKQPTAAACCES